MVAQYSSSCCSVAPTIQWSSYDWISIDGNPHLTIGYQLGGESQMQMQDGWASFYELNGPRYGELTISMAECKVLVLVTLAGIEKWPRLIKGATKGCHIVILFLVV